MAAKPGPGSCSASLASSPRLFLSSFRKLSSPAPSATLSPPGNTPGLSQWSASQGTLPLTSGLIRDDRTNSSREVRLKLPSPSWRWEWGDGCGPLATRNNKTSTLVTSEWSYLHLTVGQSYRRSKGVKADRSDIDSSFTCQLRRQKWSDGGPEGWCSPAPPTAARTDTIRISPFLSTSFLLLDLAFAKNGRQLSEEKTLNPPNIAVFVRNTLLQTALRGSATTSYWKRMLYPQYFFVLNHMTRRTIFWSPKNSSPHLLWHLPFPRLMLLLDY